MIKHDNLEEFRDPANYDLEEAETTKRRIGFYTAIAQEYGEPVLDLACGSGLLTIPLAEAGLAMTGVDLAPEMLAYARYKSEQRGIQINWIEADARNFALGQQFRTIVMTGNAFQAFLERHDQEALLAMVKQHLTASGIFVFETRNPSGHQLESFSEEQHWNQYRSVEGYQITVSGNQIYDPITQTMHWTTYRRWNNGSADQMKITRIACRFTYPQELATLLHYNGFNILKQYGDVDQSAVTALSPSIITICTHR